MPLKGYKQSEEHRQKISSSLAGNKHWNWKGGSIKVICLQCGKTFDTYYSELKRGRGKYCSQRCLGQVGAEYRKI